MKSVSCDVSEENVWFENVVHCHDHPCDNRLMWACDVSDSVIGGVSKCVIDWCLCGPMRWTYV